MSKGVIDIGGAVREGALRQAQDNRRIARA